MLSKVIIWNSNIVFRPEKDVSSNRTRFQSIARDVIAVIEDMIHLLKADDILWSEKKKIDSTIIVDLEKSLKNMGPYN